MAVACGDSNPQHERRLLDAFAKGASPFLDGLRAALELRVTPGLLAGLDGLSHAASPVAVAAWTVAAAQGANTLPARRQRWMEDDASEVRRLVWRAEARLGERVGHGQYDGLAERDYLRAFGDPDREVRRAAIEAAARTRQPWLLRRLRSAATEPSVRAIDEHLALAALGGPADIPLLLAVSRAQDIGWYRFAVLALCGRAPAVHELLRWMGEGSAVEAALAGAAFFRVTGIDVQRSDRVPLVPEGAEPDELSDEIKACDVGAAEKKWRQVEARMGDARWARGVAVESLPVEQLPLTLDLEARWSLQLRAAFTGKNVRVAFDTERFPFG